IGKHIVDVTKRDSTTVGTILARLGWEQKRTAKERYYVRPPTPPPPPPSDDVYAEEAIDALLASSPPMKTSRVFRAIKEARRTEPVLHYVPHDPDAPDDPELVN
ncbi:MAG: hypothetical protein ACO3JL_06825, partial [Myxococcota bacterium]